MADKTDDITAFIDDVGRDSQLIRSLHELRRLRAMVKRLEEWAVQLETPGIDGPGVGLFIAAELRNRMKGT